MIIIIPLGGIGQRFKSSGYKRPKALINVLGKPILYYLLDNLNVSNVNFVCIPYNKEYFVYHFEEQIQKDYPSIKFVFMKLHHDTEGAAETINLSLKTFVEDVEDQPILCLDGDNFYTQDIVSMWGGTNKIFMFEDYEDNSNLYSYLKVEGNIVKDIVEKVKISPYASSGAYGFQSYKELLEYTQRILDRKIKQKGEFYTSTAIREMIQDGKEFSFSKVLKQHYHCLGTPFQVKLFANHATSLKPLRFCFDLDNTLVTFPRVHDDYTTVMPIMKNIQFLREMKSRGHTIIIHTARRMKSCGGNTGKALKDVGMITFNTLEKFEIPYDEIYFGKPQADFYIDDLAINAFDNVEKEIGFYVDTIHPRDFNKLENATSIDTVIKSSSNLSGEIYYYLNAPHSIQHFFPLLIDYDSAKHQWLKIEKINGLTLTELYLQELLSFETLESVMDALWVLQDTEKDDADINIYSNYLSKVMTRYNNYDYSKFANSKIVYQNICNFLQDYETLKKGSMTVVHGDPVMTNILIDTHGNIKFIDMRGKQGDKETIYGDWLYDWSKLYQSLVGYDKILQNKQISLIYEEKMIKTFENKFIDQYSETDFINLKNITKSLLFSLIPLHDNEKCFQYYDLIFSIK
jgi:capsule biosynthesis phosphatase